MSGSADRTALQGARILAVEDDFVVLLEIATVLTDAGAIVMKCTSVEQALQAIEADRFGAAVLVRVGRETIAAVAHELAERGTPFVFYTGQVTHEPTISQRPQACMIAKPAPAAVLVNAVAELLDSAQPRRPGG